MNECFDLLSIRYIRVYIIQQYKYILGCLKCALIKFLFLILNDNNKKRFEFSLL